MKTYTLPNGITITWNGDLTEKIRILEDMGIEYVPTIAEISEQTRKDGAKAQAKLATELKTLTPQQAVDYIETNVTSLATAKIILKIMARMLIAMRNEIWPDLPEST